jgi:hypothetical protein
MNIFAKFCLAVRRKTIKVLTNEKGGGLTVISFDRSRFKLLTLRFSNKSVHPVSII